MEFPWDLGSRKKESKKPQTKEEMVNMMKAIAGVGVTKQKKQTNANRRNKDMVKVHKNYKK